MSEDARELDETLGVDPIRSTERCCPDCWLIYNAALGACPTLDCET